MSEREILERAARVVLEQVTYLPEAMRVADMIRALSPPAPREPFRVCGVPADPAVPHGKVCGTYAGHDGDHFFGLTLGTNPREPAPSEAEKLLEMVWAVLLDELDGGVLDRHPLYPIFVKIDSYRAAGARAEGKA